MGKNGPMRTRRIPRCEVCGLHRGLCLCAELPQLATTIDVVVVLHRLEHFKSTNTGRLAARMLQRGAYVVRGGPPAPPEPPREGSWVLFPSASAVPLREAMARGLDRLIVPDGTWPQAGKIARRDPLCVGLPTVKLEATPQRVYRLRKSTRPDALSTLESIAEALRIVEGPEVARSMLATFDVWLERARKVRSGAHPHIDPA